MCRFGRVLTCRPGQVRSGQVKSGQVRSGQVKSRQVRSGHFQVFSGQKRPSRKRSKKVGSPTFPNGPPGQEGCRPTYKEKSPQAASPPATDWSLSSHEPQGSHRAENMCIQSKMTQGIISRAPKNPSSSKKHPKRPKTTKKVSKLVKNPKN